MNVATSRITSKGQTTIPKDIRTLLDVGPGDEIVFEVRELDVIVRKLPAVDREWLKAVGSGLSEWADNLDDEL